MKKLAEIKKHVKKIEHKLASLDAYEKRISLELELNYYAQVMTSVRNAYLKTN